MHANKGTAAASVLKTENGKVGKESESTGAVKLHKERILKVSWEKVREGYRAERLREVFSRFGEVEDVVIKNEKRGSALFVTANKDAAVAATGALCGDLSNPLLVLPLQPPRVAEVPIFQKSAKHDDHVGGMGYQAFEDAVLKKMKMAAEKQRNEK